jgi:hypothetical protein
MIGVIAEKDFQARGIVKTSACISDSILLYAIPKSRTVQHACSLTVTSRWTAAGNTSEDALAKNG